MSNSTRPGMDLVLSVLRGEPLHVAAEDEWLSAIQLAENDQVLPLFLQHLPEEIMPFSLQEIVWQKKREVALSVFFLSSELKALLRTFCEADVPVMPLKGPFFAERIYGDKAYRTSKDLDLIVCAEDRARAGAALEEIGFRCHDSLDGYASHWHRDSVMVELHCQLADSREFPCDMDAVWARATQALFQGEPAWLMDATDELLYLCLHGTRHKFERLSYCVDILMAAGKWNAIHHGIPLEPEKDTLKAVALLGFAMAQKLNPLQMASMVVPAPAEQMRWMEGIADGLWRTLTQRKPADPKGTSWHAYYVRLEFRPWRRWMRRLRHAAFLSTRLIETDFMFAAKFGAKRRWQVALLRPVRVLLRFCDGA